MAKDQEFFLVLIPQVADKVEQVTLRILSYLKLPMIYF